MAYMTRKADFFLEEWKNRPERMPLIISGARQVGKTETIRHFASAHYESVVEINFITHPQFKAIVENGYSADAIVKLISRIDPALRFLPGRTLIFFDEVQEFPEIATSLKFFRQDGSYDVICSGSLLGVHYKRIASISVGSKTDYQMFSMDFEEFLWARGYGRDTVDDILGHMHDCSPMPEILQKLYFDLFLDYCILGGMPQIIRQHIDSGTFENSLSAQRQMLIDYEGDARKYAEGLDQAKIVGVLRSVPAQLAKENKKFQYSGVAKGARARDYLGCVEWLSDAGIVNICRCLHFPELPLRGNADDSRFKLYMADTGLLMASLDEEAQEDVRSNRNLGVYKGALYENFAAEALVKQGYELYYYRKDDSTLEEDFFVRTADELIPVEVKSNRQQGKSLRQLITSSAYPDISHGIKFIVGNFGRTDSVFTFPCYCMFLLKRYLKDRHP